MSNEYYLDQIKKCVTFIFNEKDERKIEPIGTGFFVSIKLKSHDAVYFVTAKHILHFKSGKLRDKVLLRINTKKGMPEFIELKLSKHVILTHPDENVDLVATVLYPDTKLLYDYLIISQDYSANTESSVQKNIREGSTVFFAGLFAIIIC